MTEFAGIKLLHNLYLGVAAGDTAALVAVPARLPEIHAAIVAEEDPLQLALYERYQRLIALHVPNLDYSLELSTADKEQDNHTPYDLAQSVAAFVARPVTKARTSPLRLAVSGIGRSGTTLIFQQLAKLLLLEGFKTNFRYEPYLWNIQSAETTGNPFDMSQLHSFGLMVHKSVPLFLKREDPLHDAFLDHLFNETWDRDPDEAPDAYLTKVIRGSGRLRSYLTRYPDLKIVACLRNPIDTINSSLGMFSFFGEEFHADDRRRFRDELLARGNAVDDLGPALRGIEWYGSWWRAFTEETLAAATEFPERVFLFCHETFQQDSRLVLEELMNFAGVRNSGMYMGLSKPAGPSIKATSLTRHDLRKLRHHVDYYKESVLMPRMGAELTAKRMDKIISRYQGGKFSFPVAGSDVGKRAPIQLRSMLIKKVESPFLKLAQGREPVLSLEDIIKTHRKDATELHRSVENEEEVKRSKTFGVIITCHNNASTISDAVLSCLNQTMPFDEIVIVNDKSSDSSAALITELADLYSSIRVLNLASNLGPSAARDLGIRKLETDFFTQLDGDDLFWPTKNASEARAVAGDESAVAFSDILLIQPAKVSVRSTSTYSGKSIDHLWKMLLARTPQVPRDMTLSRQLYFSAGGYDMTNHLYEDWDFKLRLAAKSSPWTRAETFAGTIYNRLSPGLSGANDGHHARALVQVFLRALAHVGSNKDDLLTSFDAAMGRFSERHITRTARAVLQSMLADPVPDFAPLAAFAGSRSNSALDNLAFATRLEAAFLTTKSRSQASA